MLPTAKHTRASRPHLSVSFALADVLGLNVDLGSVLPVVELLLRTDLWAEFG